MTNNIITLFCHDVSCMQKAKQISNKSVQLHMNAMKCAIQINYPIIYLQLTMSYKTKTDLVVDSNRKIIKESTITYSAGMITIIEMTTKWTVRIINFIARLLPLLFHFIFYQIWSPNENNRFQIKIQSNECIYSNSVTFRIALRTRINVQHSITFWLLLPKLGAITRK